MTAGEIFCALPEIEFEKIEFYSKKQLLRDLPKIKSDLMAHDSVYRSEWIQQAELIITDMYMSEGFFETDVLFHKVFKNENGKKTLEALKIEIIEGERFEIESVAIEVGDKTRSLVGISDLQSEKGAAFRQDVVFDDKRRLLKIYGDAGYVRARVKENLDIDYQNKQVSISFNITSGIPLSFQKLLIRSSRAEDDKGQKGKTDPDYLRSLLALKTGDTIRYSSTNNFRQKLSSTRMFNSVRLRDSLLDPSSGRSVLILETEEKIPGLLDFGLFYETKYGFGSSVDFQHRNIKGRFNQIRFFTSVQQRRQEVLLGYGSPLLFGSRVRFDTDVQTTWWQYNSLDAELPPFYGHYLSRFSSRLSRSFLKYARFISEAELAGERERVELNNNQNTDTVISRHLNINYINSSYFVFLDNEVQPTDGFRIGLIWGNGGPLIKGGRFRFTEFRHNWIKAETAFFLPLGEYLVWAGRFDTGRFWQGSEGNTDRFYLGGPRNVRSFGWREIYPPGGEDPDVKAEMIPAFSLLSGEFRWSLNSLFNPKSDSWTSQISKIQLVPFFDIGHVWDLKKPKSEQDHGKAFGIGGGIRYSLFSVLSLRLDYAWGKNGLGSSSSAFIVDLSQAF